MSRVASIETFIVTVPRDTPYLGPLAPDERVNARGYVVRKGNGTIYPVVDRSIVVRITTEDGAIGWGETYGICAPRATCEIINDLLAPVVDRRESGRRRGDLGRAVWLDARSRLQRRLSRRCHRGDRHRAVGSSRQAARRADSRPARDDGQRHRSRLSVGPAVLRPWQSASRLPSTTTRQAIVRSSSPRSSVTKGSSRRWRRCAERSEPTRRSWSTCTGSSPRTRRWR